ncbi:hypothetical protein AC578_9543 [Pseudocercospora eumusae]|uniref:F-box domain-containing protein n=1 Tax=Pseudocercospora eumusae TaxID=321146 RepID=A0A139HG28_9PEZI|nr:hypothetical protein AC578_9543 [Pseudocercospora eumusae]
MSLITIPPELRLRIYEYLPDLQPNNLKNFTGHAALTPSTSRTCHLLRHETIPIYASNSQFIFNIDDAATLWSRGTRIWAQLLFNNDSLSRVRSIYLSQHWQIPQPMRWQGHVGFYLLLERRKTSEPEESSFPKAWSSRFVLAQTSGLWTVTTGTYPVSKDVRGMRLESVELLASTIRRHFSDSDSEGLVPDDIDFSLQAMNIVATHPVLDLGLQRRQDIWLSMEDKLHKLIGRTTVMNTDACKHGSIAAAPA